MKYVWTCEQCKSELESPTEIPQGWLSVGVRMQSLEGPQAAVWCEASVCSSSCARAWLKARAEDTASVGQIEELARLAGKYGRRVNP